MVASISISRANFQENKVVIVPVKSMPSKAVAQDHSDDQSNRYKFRNRKRKQENPSGPPAKRSRALAVPNEVKPKLIVAKKEELSEGNIVLAHMKSYSAWPARILAFGKSFVNVYFFGDETTGNVPFENIGFLNENHRLLKFNVQKNVKRYERAVRCMELAIKLPSHLSVLNES